MPPPAGGRESLDEDTLGHAGTAEQPVIWPDLLREKSRGTWREARQRAETTAEDTEVERHQGHRLKTN